jgi:RNA polymerase sigma factor (sigma-70 family)
MDAQPNAGRGTEPGADAGRGVDADARPGAGADSELLAALAAGVAPALAVLMQKYAPPVLRYAWALVGSRADVEEVVQDTFLTCWRKASGIELVDSSLLPWLLTTCRYLSLNANRARQRHDADPLPDDPADAATHRSGGADDDASDARDRLRWVMAEMEQLSAIDRAVCELCLIEGRSYSEAAEQLGISVGAVRQRVFRSRNRLRKAVTQNEE